MPHILLVDDETTQRQALCHSLESQGISVTEAGSVSEAEQNNDLLNFDLIITEFRFADEAGTDLIKLAHPVPVIILSRYASLSTAVTSMKLGAVDYLAKPCAEDDLIAVVRDTLDSHPLTSDGQKAAAKSSGFFEGACPHLRRLQQHIKKVAATDSNVLILGETGTGKELTAKQVHAASNRANRRMIAVNCAAIPDTLIESELFGYEKGAFTGANTNRIGLIEAADGGTLFLDEIGELPLAAQARLLRFIQEGEIRRIGAVSSRQVNVRLICATHRELGDLASRNEFRQDLYYRINVLRLEIPPLRDRGADIRSMAEWFAETIATRMECPLRLLSHRALDAITRYSWPGNVRELEHAIERGVVMAEGQTIESEDLGLPLRRSPTPIAGGRNTEGTVHTTPSDEPAADEELSLEDYFQRFVLEHQDSMSETELAQKLGISRKCLWERRQRFDLPRNKPQRRKRA